MNQKQKMLDALPDTSFAFIDADGKRFLPYKKADGSADSELARESLAELDDSAVIPADKKDALRETLKQILGNTKTTVDRAWHSSIQIMADQVGDLPSRIMLMKTGTWDDSWKGKLAITEADLRQYKTNFDEGIGVPGRGKTGLPIDFSHEDNKAAAGWIKGLEIAPSDDPLEASKGVMALYGNPVDWTSAGREALVGGTYKCISPSFFPAGRGGWEDPEDVSRVVDNVLVGAGLTNIPFFAGLSPILASNNPDNGGSKLKNVIFISASKKGESMLKLDEVRVKAAADLNDDEKQFLADNKDKLSGDELKKFGLEASQDDDKNKISDEDRQLLADIKDGKIETVKKDDDKNVVVSADRLKRLETTAERFEHEKAEQVVEAHVKRGAIKADTAERWINRLLQADAEDRKDLEEDLKALPDNKQIGTENGSDDEGHTAATATAELEKLADEKIAAAKKDGVTLTPQDAFKQVNAERPELYETAYAGREKSKETE